MSFKEKITYKLTDMDSGRKRIEFYVDDTEFLALYYEKAKKGFSNKPIGMNSWACVEAKYGDKSVYELIPDIDPMAIMVWGQEIISTEAK